MGVISEQGIEAMHRVVKNIFKDLAFAIKDKGAAFKFVMVILAISTIIKMKEDGYYVTDII